MRPLIKILRQASSWSSVLVFSSINRTETPPSSPPPDKAELPDSPPDPKSILLAYAKAFCGFSDASPSTYHTISLTKSHLANHNFQQLYEAENWDDSVQPGGRYFVSRCGDSGCSLTAFVVGELWKPGNPFAIVATHIDSPCLRVKPRSRISSAGVLQVGIETYGGGLWHTWFDRDLSIAGRVLVTNGPEAITSKLVKINRPILRVPSLAMHYDRQNPFKFDLERNITPIAGTSALETTPSTERPEPDSPWKSDYAEKAHHSFFVRLIAEELAIRPDDIVDFDLSLYDTQTATIGGVNHDFIHSRAIDNLMMTYCGLEGFLQSATNVGEESSIRVLTLFDSEEISSTTAASAGSNFLPNILRRLSLLQTKQTINDPSVHERALARSWLISADQIHALHPNYPNYHEPQNSPELNHGPVVYSHSSGDLIRNTPGLVLIRQIAKRSGVSHIQSLVPRNDYPCGTTLGQYLAKSLGIKTVEIGNCQWSMHSIRETAGTYDIQASVELIQGFYEHFSNIEKHMEIN